MGRLFGTDGIRGAANQYPMTPEMAVRIGQAVADFFSQQGRSARILIGKDTRISGDMLEHALISGICSVGGDALLAGVLPTPGVAFTTRHLGLDAGIVVSASHNPFHDNGIKIFGRDGFKLPDETERRMECRILEDRAAGASRWPGVIGRAYACPNAVQGYVAFLKTTVPENETLRGLHIVLDCANGATYEAAPATFRELGAQVQALFTAPDGRNINQGCGSEHAEKVAEEVLKMKADAGFAFDGDGDRVIAVDEKGQILSGDRMLVICAQALKQGNRLANNVVVSTVMSNMGLELALRQLGIEHVVTQVGDRCVVQEMVARGGCLGGEDSGHMIFLREHTTGDGILTALCLSRAFQRAGRPLSELSKIMKAYPQRLVNIEVRHKPALEGVPEIIAVIQDVERKLGSRGRVFVRYSGTEPVCRIMVEAPTTEESEQYCGAIAAVIRQLLT